MARVRFQEAVLAALVAAAVAALLGQGADLPLVRGLETASLDLRMRLRGPLPPGSEMALILADDRSLAALGRWPFSRRVFASTIDRLAAAGARGIVFDLLFSEPEQPVAPALRIAARAAAEALSAESQAPLRAALGRLADDDPDADLAAAIRRAGTVLLGFAFTFAPGAPKGDPGTTSAFLRFEPGHEDAAFTLTPEAAITPLDALTTAAAGLGHVTIAYDRDGAPRYEYLVLPYEADFYPSLSVRAAALYLGGPWNQVGLALGEGLTFGAKTVPTDRAMRLLINYRGPPGTFTTWSLVDLLAGRVPPDALRNRLVLVGAAATGINDSFRTAFGSTPLAGVERMANAVSTILHGDGIARPEILAALEPVAVVAVAGAAGLLTALVPTSVAVFVASLAPLLWTAAAQIAFDYNVWLGLIMPLAALIAAMLAVLLLRYAVVDRESRQVRTAFRHYLAPALVAELAAHPERLQLGGEVRTMTVLFCDIRNFTRLSETMPPHHLVTIVNRFFTPMTEIIQAHHGTVDKYIGDCVMAFWNAPLDDPEHARHACLAALAMLDEVERLADRLAADFPDLPRLAAGIGLNSGPCCVGNLGSRQRFDYSVVGNTVNVASRIESLCKTYRLPLLAGAETQALAPDLPWQEVDRVLVRGLTTPTRIWTVQRGTATASG